MLAMELGSKEKRFAESHEICRLATCSDNRPHVVPVGYILKDGLFYIAVDYGTKKLANIKRNNSVALIIDTSRPNRALMVEGEATIVERGPEFKSIYKDFYAKFSWVRADPWGEDEAPFIVVKPTKKVSWGL